MRASQSWMKADIFRRIPKDLTEATATGAIVSIGCVVVMVLLVLGEIISFAFPRTQTDMVVLQGQSKEDRMKVFMDIDMHRLPCYFVSVDIVDIMKNHEVGSRKDLKHIRLNSRGSVIGESRVGDPVDLTEGCRLQGFVWVTKVPGNFHISCHTKVASVKEHFPNGLILDHTIRTLAFEPNDATGANSRVGSVGRPLEGVVVTDQQSTTYQYFVNVVPTVYSDSFFTTYTYQYTLNTKRSVTPPPAMSVLYFPYDFSPIAVKYSSGRVSFTHFLTYICAIVGGVYTVAGLLSRFIHTTASQFQKRFMGKSD